MLHSRYHRIAYAQNFLKSTLLVDSLLERSSIVAGELVYDLGAGPGIITDRLARRGCRVVAIEKDAALSARLRERYRHVPLVKVVEADILHVPLPGSAYKVFANIPFNATAAIVTRLTQNPHMPDDAYLVMQREAAAKFAGLPRETLFALLLKPWFEPSIVHQFDRCDFEPAPNVEIVMLRLRKRGPPLLNHTDTRLYRDFIVHCFTRWQPSLYATLKDLIGPLEATRFRSRLRLQKDATPALLSFEQWMSLFQCYRRGGFSPAHPSIAGAEQHFRRVARAPHRFEPGPANRRDRSR